MVRGRALVWSWHVCMGHLVHVTRLSREPVMANKDKSRKPDKKQAARSLKEKRAAKKAKKDART